MQERKEEKNGAKAASEVTSAGVRVFVCTIHSAWGSE